MSQSNTPKDVRAFCYERRYYNTALRFTEVERVILLAEDTRSLTAEDVARGINFVFVPLEAILVPSVSDLSDFYRCLLRINFEAALARLRRQATMERHNVMAQESATPIQLNHSLLRMFVPQDPKTGGQLPGGDRANWSCSPSKSNVLSGAARGTRPIPSGFGIPPVYESAGFGSPESERADGYGGSKEATGGGCSPWGFPFKCPSLTKIITSGSIPIWLLVFEIFLTVAGQ
jgi:hypothetical protein